MRISKSKSNSRTIASIAAALFGALLLLGAVPEFGSGAGWIDSAPLSPAQLRGKDVLVDFWEYTCINCLRTLPYLREWYRRYRDDGLVIVGVHTPEFAFSGDDKNVAAAVKRLGIAWPVVLDDDYAIWKRYNNSVWPHEFLYDQKGTLVESQEGEGGYQQTEAKIQSLLRAENPQVHLPVVMPLLPQDSYDKPGAVCYPMTPETYVGPWHGQRVVNAPVMAGNLEHDTLYRDPGADRKDGSIYLQGFWHVPANGQAMISGGNDGYAALRYHAIQVVAVMRPEQGAVRVNVTQDGKPLARTDAGSDIRYDSQGASYVNVDAAREYDLVMNAHYGSHELRLFPQHYGLGLYSFDFESCEVPGTRPHE